MNKLLPHSPEQEIAKEKLSSAETDKLGDVALKASLEAYKQEQEAVGRGVISTIELIEARFPKLGEAEAADVIRIGTATLPVISFGEAEVDEAALVKITKAYEAFVYTAGEDNAAETAVSLAIVEGNSVDEGRAIAQADRDSGVIRLAADIFSKKLLSEKSDQDNHRLVGEIDPAIAIVVHELGHIIDFNATRELKDPDARVVKQFFKNDSKGLIDSPTFRKIGQQDISQLEVDVKQGSDYVTAKAGEVYGQDAVVEAPSSYARKTPGEYFAESYMSYALNGKLSEPLRGMIRSTIDRKLYDDERQYGPQSAAQINSVFRRRARVSWPNRWHLLKFCSNKL